VALPIALPPYPHLLTSSPVTFLLELGSLMLIEGLVIFLVPMFVRAIVPRFSLTFWDGG
jgi:hypothetical protein